MNQYGIIPLSNCGLIEQDYQIATPETWQVTKDEIDYGGVEDNEFTEDQKNEIETLGGMWFENAAEFNKWFVA